MVAKQTQLHESHNEITKTFNGSAWEEAPGNVCVTAVLAMVTGVGPRTSLQLPNLISPSVQQRCTALYANETSTSKDKASWEYVAE